MVLDVYCGVIHLWRSMLFLGSLVLNSLVWEKLRMLLSCLSVELFYFGKVKFGYHWTWTSFLLGNTSFYLSIWSVPWLRFINLLALHLLLGSQVGLKLSNKLFLTGYYVLLAFVVVIEYLAMLYLALQILNLLSHLVDNPTVVLFREANNVQQKVNYLAQGHLV